MKYKIAVVEDEKDIRNLIKEILESKGYEVNVFDNGLKAYKEFSSEEYHLVISDVMMPNLDGYSLVEMIRRQDKTVPIIMLTALSEEYDEMKAFDLGVDDFIKKPFSVNVLLRRVENLLNRTYKETFQEENIEIDKLTITPNKYEVMYDNIKITLTLKEFQILLYIVKNRDHVVSREQIMEAVWGYEYYGDVRNIDTHIKNIRKKIPQINIKTVTGIGYSFASKFD